MSPLRDLCELSLEPWLIHLCVPNIWRSACMEKVHSNICWKEGGQRKEGGLAYGGSEGKASACNAGDLGSISRSGRSPG